MDNGASSYHHFLEGDENAFSEILDMYRDSLIFFINRTVNNLSVAEELAADSFSELLVHPGRYDFSVSLKTYIFTIAHHKTVSYVRRAVKFAMVPIEEAPVKSMEYASFEEEVIKEEQKKILHNALSELPEDYRTVLHLIYFEEMSYAEAGKVMHKNVKQITNLAYRGKNALRVILEKGGFKYEE
ncbi:MAG: RNA polymerase sigma factor [Butyrivibrio sp.]